MNEPARDDAQTPLPEDLLDRATSQLLAADAGERASVCEALARAHPQHRAALQRLLRRIGGAEALLADSFPPPSRIADPTEIAGHRVVRRLGEGAFGTVFLCRQQQPVERLVALKIIRPGHGEADLLRRFHAERQVLASLNHPSIAQVYDAGTLPDGRPYFVMEFVDGLPFTQYCKTRQLEPDQRLRLFVDLCHGVEHAHGRGVVHRDLKPGNVLVVEAGGRPTPKIIDFGIAKALMTGDDAAGPRTETGRVMGTPGYMSPEQAAGRTDEIDARTDVFALGVMLYELLTGDLPWPRGAIQETATDPALPSVRITKNARRGQGCDPATARRLAAAVRGDLDWITLMAIRRERDERYRSARELAEDLERHLDGLPVRAARPTLRYRLRKAYRRHRVAALSLAASVAIAAAGLSFALWSAGRGTDEALAAFDGLLRHANDAAMHATPQNEALRRSLASDALAAYDRHLRDRPNDPALVRRRVRALVTLSEVHSVLGHAADALRTADEAAADAETLLAANGDDVALRALFADATRKRVQALQLAQDFKASLPLCERAVAELDRCAAADPTAHTVQLSQALRELSLAQQTLGALAPSIVTGARAVTVLEQLNASGERADAVTGELVWARFVLAGQLGDARRFDDAEAQLAAAEAALPRLTAEIPRMTAIVYCQQGRVAWQRGDVDAALPRMQRGVAACEAWLRQEPNQVRAQWTLFEAVSRLARAQEAKGDWPTATQTMARAVALAEDKARGFPEDRGRIEDVRLTTYEFGRALWNRFHRSDLTRAAMWLRRCVELTDDARDAVGFQRPHGWEAKSVQALIADSAGEPTDAMWDALAAELPAERALPGDEPAQQVVEAWLGVVRSRLRRDRTEDARAAMAAAKYYLDGKFFVDDKLRSEAAYWRARLALAGGDLAAADAALQELLKLRGSWWGHWRAGDCAFAAWRSLLAKNAPAADVAAWRDRAAASYEAIDEALAPRVQKEADDPWLVVPWGTASLGLAIIEADRGDAAAARSRIDSTLASLTRVEPESHRDLWDAARVADARELARRLADAR